MASAKTSSFWLTEQIRLSVSGTVVQGTIDLSSYVDVGDRQGVAIEDVEFIHQGFDTTTSTYVPVGTAAGAGDNVLSQLTDLNRGLAFVGANDRSIVGSGELNIDDQAGIDRSADMFPDNYGPAAAQGARIVVNDQLYFTGGLFGAPAANHEVRVTARIKAKIVKLNQNDWMAIAIQSTAADN